MSGPNAPPRNQMMRPPPGVTTKPMGADRIPQSSDIPYSPRAAAIKARLAGGPPPMPPTMPATTLPDPRAAVVAKMLPDGVWEGTKTPTPADIAKVNARPTDTNVESFEQQFGPGSVRRYSIPPALQYAPSRELERGYVPIPGEGKGKKGKQSSADEPQTVNRSAKGPQYTDQAYVKANEAIQTAGAPKWEGARLPTQADVTAGQQDPASFQKQFPDYKPKTAATEPDPTQEEGEE
jgi:hypothetical protein